MILVDTNILLRSAQPSHRHFAAAIAGVKTARQRGYMPCIVPQVCKARRRTMQGWWPPWNGTG
jgi:hypothetical protein